MAAGGVLLDALDALGDQREALIPAGAQAICSHTGAADLAVTEFTTDDDLIVNPEQLKTESEPCRVADPVEIYRIAILTGLQASW